MIEMLLKLEKVNCMAPLPNYTNPNQSIASPFFSNKKVRGVRERDRERN